MRIEGWTLRKRVCDWCWDWSGENDDFYNEYFYVQSMLVREKGDKLLIKKKLSLD